MTMATKFLDRDANYWKNSVDEFHANNNLRSGPIQNTELDEYFKYISPCENINANRIPIANLVRNPPVSSNAIFGHTSNYFDGEKITGHEMAMYKMKIWSNNVDQYNVPKFEMRFWNFNKPFILTRSMLKDYGFQFFTVK